MMASQPTLKPEETPPANVFPKRRRRFKIFEQSTRTEPEQEEPTIELKINSTICTKQEKQLSRPAELNSGFVKIPKKITLQNEFYADDDIELLEVPSGIQGITTVGSQKFGVTDSFKGERPEPSVLFINDSLVINEASVLFKSVLQIKSNTDDFSSEAKALAVSMMDLQASMSQMKEEGSCTISKLLEFQEFIEQMKNEKSHFEEKVNELEDRVDKLEIRRSLESGHFQDLEHSEQFQEFAEQQGLVLTNNQDEDEFVETIILPAYQIDQFIKWTKTRSQESAKKKKQEEIEEIANSFHPCLGLTPQKYSTILGFIAEECPNKKEEDICLSLLFRKGTVDLDTDWVGHQDSLEYKESLLFIFRTSMNKVIGGFISNYLIEGEVREDPHAFLFSLQQQCYKFKVKEENANEAFQCSRHYLVCFGSDLMISSDCLQEQSYCEWPSSYEGKELQSMSWLAGDFTFMIEYIQVYEVTIR